MRRHDFDPAAFVAGLVFLGLAAAYFLDASGTWAVSWYAALVFTGGGLGLAWLSAVLARVLRTYRRSRASTGRGTDTDADMGTGTGTGETGGTAG